LQGLLERREGGREGGVKRKVSTCIPTFPILSSFAYLIILLVKLAVRSSHAHATSSSAWRPPPGEDVTGLTLEPGLEGRRGGREGGREERVRNWWNGDESKL